VGLGVACALAPSRAAREPELRARRDRLEARLLTSIPGSVVAGRDSPRLPQTTALMVPGRRSEDLLAALDLAGVRASAGSACSSGALEPSHVLAAMGVPDDLARGVVRLSFGETTTDDELDLAVQVLSDAVQR
jgi:cysteine desulfurase